MSDYAASRVPVGFRWGWSHLLAILALAALVRLIFFASALGTDELVYLTHAYHLLHGDYLPTAYIGGMRDGINAFLAASLWLFGRGTAGADGLFFACSLGQVALTYAFAGHLWGRRAALWAGIAMAALPLEIVQAGSLQPDPYLGLMIALSIVVFYFAERADRPALYLAAGLLVGWVFWIKQVVVVYALVFVFLALTDRRWRVGWLWFAFGAALLLVAHLALFAIVYGDPLYFFEAYHNFVIDTHISVDITDTSPWTYIILLFVNIYHTGLVGWLALAACILATCRGNEPRIRFVLVWGLGLLAIFSLMPISFSPLKFIAKQSNYMDIFMMPLALLAGWFLAQQRRGITLILGGAMVASGIALSALEQQVVQVVTVNGRAAAAFAENHAGIPVFGPLTAQRQSMLARLLRGSLDGSHDIQPYAELRGISDGNGVANEVVAYIIEDPQMRNWSGARTEVPLPRRLQECVVAAGQLDPGDLGLGHSVLAALRGVASLMPGPVAGAFTKATDPLWQVVPAKVYAVTGKCAREAQL